MVKKLLARSKYGHGVTRQLKRFLEPRALGHVRAIDRRAGALPARQGVAENPAVSVSGGRVLARSAAAQPAGERVAPERAVGARPPVLRWRRAALVTRDQLSFSHPRSSPGRAPASASGTTRTRTPGSKIISRSRLKSHIARTRFDSGGRRISWLGFPHEQADVIRVGKQDVRAAHVKLRDWNLELQVLDRALGAVDFDQPADDLRVVARLTGGHKVRARRDELTARRALVDKQR